MSDNELIELFLKDKNNTFGHNFNYISIGKSLSGISDPINYYRYSFRCDCGMSTICDLLSKKENDYCYLLEDTGRLIEFNNRKFYYWYGGLYTYDEMIIKNIIE